MSKAFKYIKHFLCSYFGLQGDPTSPSERKSVLNSHWKDWCWSWNSNTLELDTTGPLNWFHMSAPSWASLPPPTPSHPSRLSQSPGLSSLGHAANPHWLLFYRWYCICFHGALSIDPTLSFPQTWRADLWTWTGAGSGVGRREWERLLKCFLVQSFTFYIEN